METLTLDTNVLRDWAWAENRSTEERYGGDPSKRAELKGLFNKLRELRDQGKCELAITNQIFTDYGKDPDELPAYLSEMIGSYVIYAVPSISTLPLIFPFVFADENEIEAILKDVFPYTKPWHKKYKRNRKDALQLYAHKVAKRDIFLTSDNAILSSRRVLWIKWGIRVMALEEYIRRRGIPVGSLR